MKNDRPTDEQKPAGKKPRVKPRAKKPNKDNKAKLSQSYVPQYAGDLSKEALMTIIAIMKENEDPKVQMAAAKMLLDKNAQFLQGLMPNPSPSAFENNDITKPDSTGTDSADVDISNTDIESAIALAKEILDALAERKTQKLDGKSDVVVDRAAGTDNAAIIAER